MSQQIDPSSLCPVCKEGQRDYYNPKMYSCGTKKTPAGIAASDKCLARQKFKRELLETFKTSRNQAP
jgi:hypothetical protein